MIVQVSTPTYRVERYRELAAYLCDHPTASTMLRQAKTTIASIFGANTSVNLRIVHFTDDEADDPDHLYAGIETSASVDAAMAMQLQFWDEWWHKQESVPDTMHFTLDFA